MCCMLPDYVHRVTINHEEKKGYERIKRRKSEKKRTKKIACNKRKDDREEKHTDGAAFVGTRSVGRMTKHDEQDVTVIDMRLKAFSNGLDGGMKSRITIIIRDGIFGVRIRVIVRQPVVQVEVVALGISTLVGIHGENNTKRKHK